MSEADTIITDDRRAELNDIAHRWVTNRVYVDIPLADPRLNGATDEEAQDVIGHIMQTFLLSWPVIALAKPEQIPSDLGGMWEEYDKAMPRGVNGRPMFFSGQILTLAEADYLLAKAGQIYDALQEVTGADLRSED